MKNKIQLLLIAIVFCVFSTRSVFSQEDAQLVALGQSIDTAMKSGSTPHEVAGIATSYWQTNFPLFSAKLNSISPDPLALREVLRKYNERSGIEPRSKDAEMLSLEDEVSSSIPAYGIGGIPANNTGDLRALKGAMGISMAGSHGRTLYDLLSVLSKKNIPSPSDILVFRIFMEKKSVIGENIFNLTDEQRKYTPADFARLAELAKHPNPVARLIAVEILDYIPNAKDDASSAVAAMMRGMANEDNPAVIKRVIERANRQRSKVYEQVLPALSRRVEATNPKLKDEAQRAMKAIEETPATP